MIAVRQVLAVNFDGGRTDAIKHQRDETARIGFKSEARHVIHQLHFFHVSARTGRINRRRRRSTFGLAFFSHSCDIVMRCSNSRTPVKYWSSRSLSRGPTLRCKSLACPATESIMLCAQLQAANLRVHFGFGALQKQAFVNFGGFFFARNQNAAARPRQAALALRNVHAQSHRRKARQVAQTLGGVLVKRNRVAKAAASRMRRRCKKTVVRRMAAVHIGMRNAAEHRKIVAEIFQNSANTATVRSRARRILHQGKIAPARKPRLLQMPKIRRGGVPFGGVHRFVLVRRPTPRARKRAPSHRESARPSSTPAPCKKRRR